MPDQTRRYREGAGYDHAHYDWSPLPGRVRREWTDGMRTAVMALLYVEYLELEPPEGTVSGGRFAGPLGSHHPDFQNYSRREFGNRIGIFSGARHSRGDAREGISTETQAPPTLRRRR